MNKVRLIPVIFFICLYSGDIVAQYFSFRNYTVEDGLPQSQVNAIFQDVRGNLWIGTNGGGLCRYTGKGFEVYSRKDGLLSDIILDIQDDEKGDLVIKTLPGISKFNGKEFLNYPVSDHKISSRTRMYRDKSGQFWFLANLNENNKPVVMIFRDSVYENFSEKFKEFDDNGERILLNAERNGSILILLGNRLYTSDGSNLKLHILNKHPQLIDKAIAGIHNDENDNLWISVRNERKNEIYRYHEDNLYPVEIPGVIDLTGISAYYNDPDGNIWIANPASGKLYQWAGGPGSSKVNVFTHADGLDISNINNILKDNEGNIWIGTDGKGLYKYGGTKFISFLSQWGLENYFIWSLFQDNKNRYWFGTSSEGLVGYNGRDAKFYPANEEQLGVIKSIIQYGEHLLLGSSTGLWEFDGTDYINRNHEFNLPEKLSITTLLASGDNFWIGTYYHGIYYIQGNETRNYTPENSDLPNSLINYIFEDKKGRIWMAVRGGLSRFDGEGFVSFHPVDYIGFSTIEQLAEGPSGDLWAATYGDGVYRITFDINDRIQVEVYNSEKGLSSDNVYSILYDGDGNIWAGCQRGADKLSLDSDGKVKSIRNYDNYEGFTGLENNAAANLIDREGKLWFGTIKGAMVYDPEMDQLNNIPPRTNISGIRLFNKTVDWKSAEYSKFYTELTPWTGLPLGLELPYKQNNIAFVFEGLSYSVPEKVTYQWKLEGIDYDWSPVSSKTEAIYTNLSPGNYSFHVRSGNNDGIWNEYPATFGFTIKPPFWGTWWFRGVILLFVFTLGLTIIGLRNKFIQEKREELEVLVAFKTHKLEQQKNEIEKSNARLTELNDEKNNIISIVAHDLKNPLTSAITMAGILKAESRDLDEDKQHCVGIIEKSMNRMNDMINRLLDLEKIEDKIIELKLEKVNLQKIIHEVNANLHSEIERKKIRISVEAEEIFARVDPDYASQIFENLISNAIKFSPPEKNVRIRMVKSNGKARTEIIDEGPGLTEEDKKQLFGKFKRLSAKPTGGEQSTGLGLSIVKKYVEAMNGKVWCESEYGKGSNFIVEFIRSE